MSDPKIGDRGPIPGTYINGECPICGEVVYSDYPTNDEGRAWHVIRRHPDVAKVAGLIE